MRNKKGFTLAEILVTLGVIGVIASMTVPTLVQDIQDAQLKTAWKKAFADLSQVTMRLVQDNGGNLKGFFTSNNFARDKYLAYLNYTKKCDSNITTWGNCWPVNTKYLKKEEIVLGNYYTWIANYSGAVLNNGSLVIFAAHSACTWDDGIPDSCGNIIVDVNGFKGPNRYGKDTFMIYILRDGIKPYGSGDEWENYCESLSGNFSGYGCAAKYLY